MVTAGVDWLLVVLNICFCSIDTRRSARIGVNIVVYGRRLCPHSRIVQVTDEGIGIIIIGLRDLQW